MVADPRSHLQHEPHLQPINLFLPPLTLLHALSLHPLVHREPPLTLSLILSSSPSPKSCPIPAHTTNTTRHLYSHSPSLHFNTLFPHPPNLPQHCQPKSQHHHRPTPSLVARHRDQSLAQITTLMPTTLPQATTVPDSLTIAPSTQTCRFCLQSSLSLTTRPSLIAIQANG
ncbi:unnamed protein product, partial [Sphenostylis stenocarpa]